MGSFKSEKATRKPLPLRLLLAGPSGSGKTFGALTLAEAFGKAITLIDTERRRSEAYADQFDFRIIPLEKPYTPERYREAIRDAVSEKPNIIITDQATHEWLGPGGILRTLDEIPGTNSAMKWKDLTPRHDRFCEALTIQKLHHIVTCRARDRIALEVVQSEGEKPRTIVKRLGLRPLQRKDFMYEYDIVLILNEDHTFRVYKDDTHVFDESTGGPLTIEDGKRLLAWCKKGKQK